METYRHALKHLESFYNMDIEDITPSMVQNALSRMSASQFSVSAISKVKIVFGLVLDYAIMQDIPLNNYMSSVKIPKGAVKNKVSAPDDEIISAITNSVNEPFGIWAMILLCTGLRRGELAALQKKDIDFDNNIIHVHRAVEYRVNTPYLKSMPKSISGIRNVPILGLLGPYLKELCKDIKDNDFIFGGGSPLTVTMINKRWAKYCRDIDIDIHQHQLRHAYAKILYRSGVDPKTAQGLLGHADIQTTMNIYTDFSEDITVKSIGMINDFVTANF